MESMVIIPVYEPEPILEELVNELWQNGNYIIIVDDGSSEESQIVFWKLAEKAIILHHKTNQGKGAAIKTGLEYIRDNFWECDVVGIMDGDGQHLTKDMEKLIFRARENTDALILGVRQVGKKDAPAFQNREHGNEESLSADKRRLCVRHAVRTSGISKKTDRRISGNLRGKV